MASIFDLHVHTNRGSPDSALTPDEMAEEASRLGLTGLMITEHVGWPRHDFEQFARDQDLVLINALELYTPLGHIITLGLDGYVTGYNGDIETIRILRKEVDRVGGAAMFVRRNLLEKVGLLDEKFFLYFEDVDWCYRFKKHGYKIIHIAGQTLTHISGEKRDLPESEMATKEKTKSVLWYFTKNRGSAYSLIVRILSIVALSIRLLFEIMIAPFQVQKGKIKTTLIMLKVFIGIN